METIYKTVTIQNPIKEYARRFPGLKELDSVGYIKFLEGVVNAYHDIYIVRRDEFKAEAKAELEKNHD